MIHREPGRNADMDRIAMLIGEELCQRCVHHAETKGHAKLIFIRCATFEHEQLCFWDLLQCQIAYKPFPMNVCQLIAWILAADLIRIELDVTGITSDRWEHDRSGV